MKSVQKTLRLKDLAKEERPQERFERLGAGALSNAELLALILRSGNRNQDVLEVAHNLLAVAGSLERLMRWTADDFSSISGIGKVKAIQVLSVVELSNRVTRTKFQKMPIFEKASVVRKYFSSEALCLDVEKCWVLCLDTRHRLIKSCEVSSGTANATLLHPREIFRHAIRCSATAVIVVHNHPSGDPSPSDLDVSSTDKLKDAASSINIRLLDHVILGATNHPRHPQGYFSFAEAGLLEGA